jgi:hypothetical protein
MKTSGLKIVWSCLAILTILLMLNRSETLADDLKKDLVVGLFSSLSAGMEQPPGWEALVFKKIHQHTRYDLVSDEGTVVVRAVSADAASGLIRKIQINPMEYPLVEWRWKVSNILHKGDVTKKEGDDYPARIYITFAYDRSKLSFAERVKYKAARLMFGEYPPTGVINYIWGNHAAIDTMVPSPYAVRDIMIAVESGSEKINQWVTQRRNLLEDYRKAFQTDPPMISGVAIMTDTDNTGESATAYYGDITFKQLPKN